MINTCKLVSQQKRPENPMKIGNSVDLYVNFPTYFYVIDIHRYNITILRNGKSVETL